MTWALITDETELDLIAWDDALVWTDEGLWADPFDPEEVTSGEWVEV